MKSFSLLFFTQTATKKFDLIANWASIIPAEDLVLFRTSKKKNWLGPFVRLSVNKKVHTCIVRETWKILWKYQKFFEKNQLGPSVCLLVIKKVHTCFEKTVQNREKCLFFFFQTRYFSSSYSKQPQGVPQSIQRSIIRLLELLLDSKMYPSES